MNTASTPMTHLAVADGSKSLAATRQQERNTQRMPFSRGMVQRRASRAIHSRHRSPAAADKSVSTHSITLDFQLLAIVTKSR